MCQQHHDANGHGHGHGGGGDTKHASDATPFPWDAAGIYDAHCHPTDTMAAVRRIPSMKASVLTIMATRSQDQDLVADLAASPLAIRSRDDLEPDTAQKRSEKVGIGRVVPSFGWHPWFSHQLYDDTIPENERTGQTKPESDAAKQAHYAAVLQPAPNPADNPQDAALLASLPEPAPLSAFINATRARLEQNPLALVGEIGLDKAFRLPEASRPGDNDGDDGTPEDGLTPGGRDGRLLSPQHVRMPHQVAVLKAQLALAGELGRPVSVHGVQAHGVLHDALAATWRGHEKEVLSRRDRNRIAPGAEDFSSSDEDEGENGYGNQDGEGGNETQQEKKSTKSTPAPNPNPRPRPKPFPPRVCLHSYSGGAQMMKQYLHPAIPARIFFSFSRVINLGTGAGASKFSELMRVCPDNRVLVESDLHVAGDEMDGALEDMYRRVCEVKGWALEEGVRRIRKNYEEFIFG